MRACLFLVFRRCETLGLLGASPVGTPPATVRNFSDFLDVYMHHLTRSFRDDDLRFSVGFAVRVDEPAAVQSPGSAGFS